MCNLEDGVNDEQPEGAVPDELLQLTIWSVEFTHTHTHTKRVRERLSSTYE
jgi:hypothetical protein